jgi:putative isomerase
MDRFRGDGRFSPVLTPASLMPLFAGIASEEAASRLATLAGDPAVFFPGMPTVAYGNPAFESGHFWRGPTWLNVAYFALQGLKDCGFVDVAERIRDVILGWCADNQDSLWEYYDSRTGKGTGAPQFGWSAAFIAAFILEWDP